MKSRNAIKQLLNISLVSMLTAVSGHVLAAGFQLFEYNGVSAGNAGAGGAAIAEDASTGFINPAGLTNLNNQQLVLSSTFVMAKTNFEGTSTWRYNNTLPFQSSGASKGNDNAIIPAFHYAVPINPAIVFGFGVTVPFGLSTKYSPDAFTRYAATTSELTAIDVSPGIGFKVTDKLSLGFGLDIEKLTATLDSVGGLPQGLPPVISNPGNEQYFDSVSQNEASDWGYGWHVGALYKFTPATRVGLSYRSQAVFHLNGTSILTGRLADGMSFANPAATASSNIRADVTLPPMTTLSLYHDVNDRLALMGSVNYTQWSTIKTITLHNVLSAKSLDNPSGLIDVSLPQDYKNTWRFSVGANYKLDAKWMLRGGATYDQAVATDVYRSIRLPDSDKTLLAIGTRYQATKMVGIDVGYTHVFFKNAPLNYQTIAGKTSTEIVGQSKSSADLIGAQVTWNLG